MRTVFYLACVLLLIKNGYCAMSDAQVKSAAKLMKNVCQPKSKVSTGQIEAMHKGSFPEEVELMAYMECCLRTAQIMKDGKLNYEQLLKQLANLPSNLSESGMVSAENCKDSVKSSDKYAAAMEFYKCFYEQNPENFFLP